jgi:hypothetical protein
LGQVLLGLITTVRPIAAIGLRNRKRAVLAALAGVCLTVGGDALLNHVCDPTIPCNRRSANRLPPLVTPAHACVPPVTAGHQPFECFAIFIVLKRVRAACSNRYRSLLLSQFTSRP